MLVVPLTARDFRGVPPTAPPKEAFPVTVSAWPPALAASRVLRKETRAGAPVPALALRVVPLRRVTGPVYVCVPPPAALVAMVPAPMVVAPLTARDFRGVPPTAPPKEALPVTVRAWAPALAASRVLRKETRAAVPVPALALKTVSLAKIGRASC